MNNIMLCKLKIIHIIIVLFESLGQELRQIKLCQDILLQKINQLKIKTFCLIIQYFLCSE